MCDLKCETAYYCDLIKLNSTENCPCDVCLLKTICVTSCDLFAQYYKQQIGFEPSEFKGY